MRVANLSLILVPVALAACDKPSAPEPEQTAADPAPAAESAPLPSEIPMAFRGRWGLSADDCEEGSQGLLEISATELSFYESVGTLAETTAATNGRFGGAFDFTGEGQSWQREIVLDLRSGGEVLVRREFGEGASPEPFDYIRCA